jgi:hypothetical protein
MYVAVRLSKPNIWDVVTRNCKLCSTVDTDDVIEQGHVRYSKMVSCVVAYCNRYRALAAGA